MAPMPATDTVTDLFARSAALRTSARHLCEASRALCRTSREIGVDIHAARRADPLRRLPWLSQGSSEDSTRICLRCGKPIDESDVFVTRFHRYRVVHLMCWTPGPLHQNGDAESVEGAGGAEENARDVAS